MTVTRALKMLMVPGMWSTETVPNSSRYQIDDLMTKVAGWYADNSFGGISITHEVTPPVQSNHPPTGGTAALSALVQATWASGISRAGFTHVVWFSTRPDGFAFWGNSTIWIAMSAGFDGSPNALIHEIGHTLGCGHANGVELGERVGNVLIMPPLGSTKTRYLRPLRDCSDIMGYCGMMGNFSIYEKALMGWASPPVFGGIDTTYTITASVLPGGACYGVKVPLVRYATTMPRDLWIEYRKKVGRDATILPGHEGVQLRIFDNRLVPQGISLIDANPPGENANHSMVSVNPHVTAFHVGDVIDAGPVAIEILREGPTDCDVRVYELTAPVIVTPPPIVPPPPPPTPRGNTQMLLDTIKAEANALVLGQITQAQIDALKADIAKLVVDATGAPPPVVNPPPVVPIAEIIVDNAAAGVSNDRVTCVGTWYQIQSSDSYGGNYVRTEPGAGFTYTWKTPPLQEGDYQVFLWWVTGGDRSQKAPVTAGGVTREFNQRGSGGQWNLHGTYHYTEGERATVFISNVNGQVCADAVKFVRVG